MASSDNGRLVGYTYHGREVRAYPKEGVNVNTLTYQDQVRARADRADALEAENVRLKRQVEELSDVAELRRHLKAVVDAAPGGNVDWKRPTEWGGFTILEWTWENGATPERFEAALDAADKYLRGMA